MKKTLVTLLALVFVLSIGATAFAAPANPFVDVPAKHWAYGAVSKLAQAGIVDGYGDGTFRGDKTMTRYEMAQIVAKAMAKSEKADAELKALIDKLAVEFAAELNNLGVRVAKLEANQSNIKFSGNAAFRYTTASYDFNKATSNQAQYRLRLEGTAKVDDKTTFGVRFVTREPDKAGIGNDTWQAFGENGQSGQGQSTSSPFAATGNNSNIDRVFFTTKIGDISTTIGRQALAVDTQGVIVDSGAFSYDGVKFGWKTGDFAFDAKWGRFLKGAVLKDLSTTNTTYNGVAHSKIYGDLDIASLGVSSKAGKFDYGVSYVNGKNPANATVITPIKWLLLDTKYTFDKQWTIQAEYLKNSADKVAAASGDTALIAKLVYGDFAIKKAGDYNLFYQYIDKKANSFVNHFSNLDLTPGTTSEAQFLDAKIHTVGINYGFSKTWSGYLAYAWTDTEADATVIGAKAKQIRAVTTVMF